MSADTAKLERDGKVAVLYSPPFGGGWSTWNGSPDSVFDPDIAAALLAGKPASEIEAIAKNKYPDAYLGGLSDLAIEWVPVGTRFTIREYDGAESVVILGPDYGYVA